MRWYWAAATVLSVGVAATGGEEPPVSADEFARLMRDVRPQERGYWEEVPWITDLDAARVKAAKEAKLLFIWSAAGHPLGCV